jgi:hypothetical protein
MQLNPSIAMQDTLYRGRTDSESEGYFATRQDSLKGSYLRGDFPVNFRITSSFSTVILTTALSGTAFISHKIVDVCSVKFLSTVRAYFNPKISKLGVARTGVMLSDMFASRYQNEIFNAVVGLISVDMVNQFCRKKRSTEVLTHDQPTPFNKPPSSRIRMVRFVKKLIAHVFTPPVSLSYNVVMGRCFVKGETSNAFS